MTFFTTIRSMLLLIGIFLPLCGYAQRSGSGVTLPLEQRKTQIQTEKTQTQQQIQRNKTRLAQAKKKPLQRNKTRLAQAKKKPQTAQAKRNAARTRIQTQNSNSSPSADQPRLWTNSIGMTFVRIEKGSFMMGSPKSDQEAGDDEKPQHRVNITKDFYMGQYEVTQDEFGAFVRATSYVTEAEKDGGCVVWNGSSWNKEANKNWRTVFVGGKRPVVCVSHNDALAYINWLNQKEGTNTYRLPTEAEWEYAARAGSSTKYSFGDDASQLCLYGNVADLKAKETYNNWTVANCNDGVGVETAVVGRYRPNAWGLYDMHGNVWEWLQDWYQGDYYKNSPSNDPSNLTKNSSMLRVLRGGSWDGRPQDLRSADRVGDDPTFRSNGIGFRLSKTL